MIKGAATVGDKTPLLILGLTRRNCERLLAGDPIMVDTGELGDPLPVLQVLIMGGETEDAMAAQIRSVATVGETVDRRPPP